MVRSLGYHNARLHASMKREPFFALHFLLILGLFGCSIDINQPTMPSSVGPISSTPDPGAIPDHTTPSITTTTIPITWAGLNLTGKLVYASIPVARDVPSISIQILNLATGEIKTLFTTTEDAWVFYMSISPDARQLVMSYIPPSQSAALPNRALYIMPLDGTTPPQ